MHRPQLIQNAAARLLTHSKRSSRITPVLAAVHWLVSFRIEFQILFFLFKALHCQAPALCLINSIALGEFGTAFNYIFFKLVSFFKFLFLSFYSFALELFDFERF